MASRDPLDLHPDVRDRWTRMRRILDAAGVHVFLTCTLRPAAEQQVLFEQGRSQPGPRVTNARAWESYHQPWLNGLALAFDFAFRPPGSDRGVDWNGPWEFAGAVAEFVGLEWGGRWLAMPDRPHCQLRGVQLAELRRSAGFEPGHA